MSTRRIQDFVFLGTRKDRHELYIRPVQEIPKVLFITGSPHPGLTEAEWRICS